MMLVAPGDKIYAGVSHMNAPGWYAVGGHGSPWFMLDEQMNKIYPPDLANRIKADPKFKGQPVLLASCNTGKDAGKDEKGN